MVLQGKYKGNLQYHEVPLVETLPPPVGADRALALGAPPVVRDEGSAPQVDPTLVDALVEGVSHDDPPPQRSKDETTKEVAIGGGRATTKRRIAWVDSLLTGYVGASTIDKSLHKRRNVVFLLRESDVLITIPNDDASYLSEGMDIEAT